MPPLTPHERDLMGRLAHEAAYIIARGGLHGLNPLQIACCAFAATYLTLDSIYRGLRMKAALVPEPGDLAEFEAFVRASREGIEASHQDLVELLDGFARWIAEERQRASSDDPVRIGEAATVVPVAATQVLQRMFDLPSPPEQDT